MLSFNIGVEAGQLFVLALVVPLLRLLFGRWLPGDLLQVIVLSAVLAQRAGTGCLIEGALLQYDISMPLMTIFMADSRTLDDATGACLRDSLGAKGPFDRIADRGVNGREREAG